MAPQQRLFDLLEGRRHQKVVLVVSVLLLLLLEIMIYFAAAGQAGRISRLIVTDAEGRTVYETTGKTLTSYQKMLFEKTHGPLSDYHVHVQTQSQPFPFRAWLSAAIGIPVGLILLLAFLIRAYLALMYGESKDREAEPSAKDSAGRLTSFLGVFRSVSIFHVGFLLVLGVVLFWMVPNILGDFAKVSLATIREFKWYFVGVSVFLAVTVLWVIYLRYKLSRQMLQNQYDLEKFRVERQLPGPEEQPAMLPESMNRAANEQTNGRIE
jgi:hypothetical protein